MTRLSLGARWFIGSVIVAGTVGAVTLLLVEPLRPTPVELLALAAFALLSFVAGASEFTHRGDHPTGSTLQMNSAFYAAPFLIGDPRLAVLAIWVSLLADALWAGKKPLQAAFNFGQLGLASTVTALVLRTTGVRFDPFDLTPRDAGWSLAALLAFVVVNLASTHIVVSLVSHRPILRHRWFNRSAIVTESLQVVTSFVLALTWLISPWLLPCAALPVWAQSRMLLRSTQREQRLRERDQELRAVSRLGLDLGRQLDREPLADAILQAAARILACQTALVALREESDGGSLRVLAWRGLPEAPPDLLPGDGLDEWIESPGGVLELDDVADMHRRFPGLSFLAAEGALLVPLSGEGEVGVLALTRDARRRPFDASDRRRLELLVPFINMALANSRLVARTRLLQDQLSRNDKLAAMGRLLAGVAHELNNPLAAVVGFGELLSADPPPDRRQPMLKQIGIQAQRAGKIVRGLLQRARRRSDERRSVDVERLIDDLVVFRAYTHGSNNIVVRKTVERNAPQAWADGDQLSQILLNLFVNAEQAIESAGGEYGEIEVDLRSHRGHLRLVVRDNGCGIPADVLRRVFDPFYTTKDVGIGTGLGLYICHQIVESHGGAIDVESTPGRGTTVTVDLPIASGREHRPERPAAGSGFPANGRALVIDDEPAIGDLLVESLEVRGWSVDVASDGLSALNRLQGERYDVLLVDLRMPGMDGIGFWKRLAEDRPGLLDRIIFITGDAEPLEADDGERWTGAPRLFKPFALDELYGLVGRVVEGEANRQV